MNTIEFENGHRPLRELTEKVIVWYISKVMPRMRTLDITVKFSNCLEKKNVYGYCMMGENNREFEIEIDKNLRLYDFVSTLCHELTHLKQYARNEMKQLDNGQVRWKKKVYSSDIAYNESPWEIEAFDIEKKLALQCFEEVL